RQVVLPLYRPTSSGSIMKKLKLNSTSQATMICVLLYWSVRELDSRSLFELARGHMVSAGMEDSLIGYLKSPSSCEIIMLVILNWCVYCTGKFQSRCRGFCTRMVGISLLSN